MNRIKFHLEPVNQRQRNWLKLCMLTIWWSLGAITYFRAQAGVELAAALPWVIAGIMGIGTFVILFLNIRRGQTDYQQLARDIEAEHPELHSALLTAIEQSPDPKTGQYNFLQQRVIDEAMATYEQSMFANAVPARNLNHLRLMNRGILILVGVCLFNLPGAPPPLSPEVKAAKIEKEEALLPAKPAPPAPNA